jgi:hypothetical protein
VYQFWTLNLHFFLYHRGTLKLIYQQGLGLRGKKQAKYGRGPATLVLRRVWRYFMPPLQSPLVASSVAWREEAHWDCPSPLCLFQEYDLKVLQAMYEDACVGLRKLTWHVLLPLTTSPSLLSFGPLSWMFNFTKTSRMASLGDSLQIANIEPNRFKRSNSWILFIGPDALKVRFFTWCVNQNYIWTTDRFLLRVDAKQGQI